MTRSYRHLTLKERCQVKIPNKSGLSKGAIVDRYPTVPPYRRPIMPPAGRKDSWGGAARTSPQGRTISILSMQIITGCLSIVARREGVSTTSGRGQTQTPICLFRGHPCKLFNNLWRLQDTSDFGDGGGRPLRGRVMR